MKKCKWAGVVGATIHGQAFGDNFKQQKNREDSPDLEDSGTESIASTQLTISEIFAHPRRQKLHLITQKQNEPKFQPKKNWHRKMKHQESPATRFNKV